MAPKLKISHLGKTFNDLHALQDVNLDVDRGEFISVVGPSGCGKTTFLRIVAGLEPASPVENCRLVMPVLIMAAIPCVPAPPKRSAR